MSDRAVVGLVLASHAPTLGVPSTHSDALANGSLDDGIDQLPDRPGIYCVMNRFSGRRGVGLASRSLRARALDHRSKLKCGRGLNRRMQADVSAMGWGCMVFIALEVFGDDPRPTAAHLRRRELWWARQLLADDERLGYNDEAGGVRSSASRFREAERRLMRSWPPKYCLLPGVEPAQPINPVLLATWACA